MLDELDDGARTGVYAALGVVALLLFGLLGGLALRTLDAKPAAKVAAAPAAAASPGWGQAAPVSAASAAALSAAAPEALHDVPLRGPIVGTMYFAVGQAALGTDAAQALASIGAAAKANPLAQLVIAGFHDASGDPAKNAELAKERAKAVRAALEQAGIDRARILLRKPENTTGGGPALEARRVEVRMIE
jgi:outer membrane protein OmpA-like peptidoglycan-associated protein